MVIQKPTVLDAARIASELNRIYRVEIIRAHTREGAPGFCLGLRGGERMLRFEVARTFAFFGRVRECPEEHARTILSLIGYRILSAEQVNYDRIIRMRLEKDDRLGRRIGADLIIELIPNKGNAFLVDEKGRIKWSLRGAKTGDYRPPGPLKKPTVMNIGIHRAELERLEPNNIPRQIYGLNEFDLRTIETKRPLSAAGIIAAIEKYAERESQPGPAWIIAKNDDYLGYCLTRPILAAGERALEFESALDMYSEYYRHASGQNPEADKREALMKILDGEITVQALKLKLIAGELENTKTADDLKLRGELILANKDRIRKGMSTINLPDLATNGRAVEIILDPSKNASANANEYFARYKKAISSVKVLERRLEATRERLSDLEQVRRESVDELEKLEEALERRGLLPRSRVSKKMPVEKRLPYKRFRASNGWEILVGRTSADNDELTLKIARKDDYWFHAWQAAGSHVVLRLPDKSSVPDKKTLLEAASLAAFHSKARTSSKVPVAYTQARYVRKPRNLPPGKVLVEKEKQLMVKPVELERFKGD
jgi:predicted ribosome quality control (RQC) complex YloA/Tae2 family protein